MPFVAGAYSATWGGTPIGMISNGFTVSMTGLGIDVTADRAGRTIIDTIHAGQDVRVSFVLAELDLHVAEELLWNYKDKTKFGDMGRLGSSYYLQAEPLTLTACNRPGLFGPIADIQNGNVAPAAITFWKTHLLNEHEVELAFTNSHRTARITMRAYPRAQITTTLETAQDFDSSVVYDYFEAT
jgi:hypothetical protein